VNRSTLMPDAMVVMRASTPKACRSGHDAIDDLRRRLKQLGSRSFSQRSLLKQDKRTSLVSGIHQGLKQLSRATPSALGETMTRP
jgi:hypothetical protein